MQVTCPGCDERVQPWLFVLGPWAISYDSVLKLCFLQMPWDGTGEMVRRKDHF